MVQYHIALSGGNKYHLPNLIYSSYYEVCPFGGTNICFQAFFRWHARI